MNVLVSSNSNSSENMALSTLEFDVKLTCGSCSEAVYKALLNVSGVKSVHASLEKQSVVVETSLTSQVIKEAIESTGIRAVLKGVGSAGAAENLSAAAVAEIKGINDIRGVIRFHQVKENKCIIDGTIDGLFPGEHGLHIYEFGDLSDGCNNLGSHFNPSGSNHGGPEDPERHYGDLGNIIADQEGRANFRFEDTIVKVDEIIGRAVAVTSNGDDFGRGGKKASKIDGDSGYKLACAIIARSAGLFQNPKRICQCDGISIWDENNGINS